MVQTIKNKKIGLFILLLAALGFAACFWLFHLDGARIDFKNTSQLLETVLTIAFLPLGLYFGLLFISGKKLALQIGGGTALFLVIAFLVGYLRWYH